MPKSPSRPLTTEVLHEEVRFLLRTLLRDDLFGEEVSLTEAEKLLESSLSLGFVEYCAFLKRHGYVDIDRERNTITVAARGRGVAQGSADNTLVAAIGAHFASRLEVAPHDSLVHAGDEPVAEEVVGERYVRYEAIGQGSLGTVYRGRNVVLGRPVALKEVRHVFEYVSYIPHNELIRRLKEAVLAQAGLDHPHVLQVVDMHFDVPMAFKGKDGTLPRFGTDLPYIVLDYAAGGSLKERLLLAKTTDEGALPVDVAVRVLFQASYALAHAHRQGVVHGGLKPENVLFDRGGNVRLADFGATRVTAKVGEPGAPFYVGVGAPSYMAPEQLHEGRAKEGADIYALGILLYQTLTGELPGRRSPMPSEVRKAIPAALDDVFDRMTKDRLEERYPSFDDVLSDLYKAFPKEKVLERGTLLLYEEDPFPPPSAEEDAPPDDDDEEAARSGVDDVEVNGEAKESAPVDA